MKHFQIDTLKRERIEEYHMLEMHLANSKYRKKIEEENEVHLI